MLGTCVSGLCQLRQVPLAGLHRMGFPVRRVLVSFGGPLAVFLRFLPDMLWPIRKIPDPANDPQPGSRKRQVTDLPHGATHHQQEWGRSVTCLFSRPQIK
jgi:hypothetical protein